MHVWLRLIGMTCMLPLRGGLTARVLAAPQHGAEMHGEAIFRNKVY